MHGFDRQRGAFILTVAFALLFLLGFMGIALDLGHMMVVKDELQTSVDACALAAAQELDGAADALTRATNAGVTAGNLNNVDFQSPTWNSQPKIAVGDITFMDASYGPTAVPANAKYAQCKHSQGGIQMWLLQAMGAFAGSTDPAYSSTKSVGALAVATRANAQSTCPIPVGLNPKHGGTAPNYGFQIGEWIPLVGGTPNSGEIGWYNLDGSTSANETKAELGEPGACGIKVGDVLGTPGVQTAADVVWNTRFGIYKGNDGPSVDHPDYTGYAYTLNNWPLGHSAYDGVCPPSSCTVGNPANFKTKRLNFSNYGDTDNSKNGLQTGDNITLLDLNGYKGTLATAGVGGQHQQFGYSRRIVLVPVLNGANTVIDWVCMLMLEPMSGPGNTVHLEFISNASDAKSPCTSNGLAGGAGPLTSVLVQ